MILKTSTNICCPMHWYYLGSSGAMLTNTTTPDGYHVDSEGRWI